MSAYYPAIGAAADMFGRYGGQAAQGYSQQALLTPEIIQQAAQQVAARQAQNAQFIASLREERRQADQRRQMAITQLAADTLNQQMQLGARSSDAAAGRALAERLNTADNATRATESAANRALQESLALGEWDQRQGNADRDYRLRLEQFDLDKLQQSGLEDYRKEQLAVEREKINGTADAGAEFVDALISQHLTLPTGPPNQQTAGAFLSSYGPLYSGASNDAKKALEAVAPRFGATAQQLRDAAAASLKPASPTVPQRSITDYLPPGMPTWSTIGRLAQLAGVSSSQPSPASQPVSKPTPIPLDEPFVYPLVDR